MPNYNGEVVIAAGAIKTIQELIQAAITARAYPDAPRSSMANGLGLAEFRSGANRELDEIGRWNGAIATTGWIRPVDGEIYIMDGFKGVYNGVVTNSHDGVTLIAGHFTGDTAGHAVHWIPGQAKDLQGLALGNQVVYAVGQTVIALDNVVVI